MSPVKKRFGDVLREKRVAKGFSLRKFAELIDVSPTYLSQVEQSKVERPPTAERIRKMAQYLDENADTLIALAGRVPEDVSEIVQSSPTQMPELLRAARGLTVEQLRRLAEQAKQMKRRKGEE